MQKILMRLLDVYDPVDLSILLHLHSADGWSTTAEVADSMALDAASITNSLQSLVIRRHAELDVRFRATDVRLPDTASPAQQRVMEAMGTARSRSYAELNPNRTLISGTKVTVNWLVSNGYLEAVDIWRASADTRRKLADLRWE